MPGEQQIVRLRTRPGDIVVAIMVMIPFFVCWRRISTTAGGATSWLTLAHRVAGVLALSTFLVSAILSVRIPRIDRFFGGLTHLWRVHHVLGLASFLLVMAHVLLIALAAIPVSKRAAIPVLFPPFSEAPVWMGWLALFFMVVFLAPSFKLMGEPRYQLWKSMHQISAAALAMSLIHVVLLSPDALVWWILGTLAVTAMLWRKVLSRFFACRPYVVTEVRTLAKGVVELSLRPEGRPVQYAAGQFFYLTPLDPNLAAGYGEEHPFTASSAPTENVLRVGIKALGDATNALLTIQPNSRVSVEGPYGSFFERRDPQRAQLWIGGGIGIAPFVAAARAMRNSREAPGGSVHLFYLADSAERAYYLDDLRLATDGMANFVLTPHYYKVEGPITSKFLEDHCADFASREIYLCGPQPMIVILKKCLGECGIPRRRIHSEDFGLL